MTDPVASRSVSDDKDGENPVEEPLNTKIEVYGEDVLLEEETLSWYHVETWYPVRIGSVIEDRFRVLVKLGFGSVSTVWLCRDLQESSYVTLKIYATGQRQAGNEENIMRHLRSFHDSHSGRKIVRTFRDSFQIAGPVGSHRCLVYDPLCMSLKDLLSCVGDKLPQSLVKPLIRLVLSGLDYLHTTCRVVHTDLQAGNIMLSTASSEVWNDLVSEEDENPTPRKILPDRIIYQSRLPEIPDDGEPVIIDFGEAVVGSGPFTGEVMPDLYRAPEIILRIPWTEKVDIWSLGLLLWDLLEGERLFRRRLPTREASRGFHMARLVALLGSPPKDLLEKSECSADFFDEHGCLHTEIKEEATTSLDREEKVLEGRDKKAFLDLIRDMLQWKPEDRPTARQLLLDPWLNET